MAVSAWLLLAPALLRADDGRHIFWEVKGAHNTVYLLGSVHMLKAADGVLPAEVLEAYRHSKSLVMELDLSDAGAADALAASDLGQLLLPEDKTLGQVLSPKLYASFVAHAKRVGLEPATSERFQPWFAAILLEQMTLMHAGYEASSGVDMQLTQSAAADHKPIVALETASEQMGYFSQLTLDEQANFLRFTLRDLDSSDSDPAAVIRAWKAGDVRELERLFRQESADSPELMRQLTAERNRKWLPRIKALLDDDHDDMVVVGAMHLIGDDGLVALLKSQGFNPVQH
ncbi:MAG: TraB/GumN family protein [Steroidobacteraceae bacterium]